MAGRKNTTSTRCREWYHYMYKRLTEIPTKAAAGEIFTCAGGKWQKETPLQCKGVMPLCRVLSLRRPPSQSSIHLGVQGGLTARVLTGDRMEIGWQGFTSRAVKKIPPHVNTAPWSQTDCVSVCVCMLIPYMCFICVLVHNHRHCLACHPFPKEMMHFILNTQTLLDTRYNLRHSTTAIQCVHNVS